MYHVNCDFVFPLLHVVPTGSPLNCTNFTFNARDVWLQWEEPLQELQNGQIMGYNLTCLSNNSCANLSTDLSTTETSNATSFTIAPISPFTQYACSLSAINEVGEGPPTQCIFTTQPDGKTMYIQFLFYQLFCISIAPDSPPENLMSTRKTHNVTLEWLPPSCPNGIIYRYIFSITMASKIAVFILSADETTITVDGFDPYEFYSVTVIASTLVNGKFFDSPPAVLMEFTLPDSELFKPAI